MKRMSLAQTRQAESLSYRDIGLPVGGGEDHCCLFSLLHWSSADVVSHCARERVEMGAFMFTCGRQI